MAEADSEGLETTQIKHLLIETTVSEEENVTEKMRIREDIAEEMICELRNTAIETI